MNVSNVIFYILGAVLLGLMSCGDSSTPTTQDPTSPYFTHLSTATEKSGKIC